MDEQGEGRLQAGRLQGGVEVMGHAQEQAGHELRNHGPRSEILLSEGHFGQGRRPEAGVPIRGGAEGHCRDRLHGSRVSNSSLQRTTLAT